MVYDGIDTMVSLHVILEACRCGTKKSVRLVWLLRISSVSVLMWVEEHNLVMDDKLQINIFILELIMITGCPRSDRTSENVEQV